MSQWWVDRERVMLPATAREHAILTNVPARRLEGSACRHATTTILSVPTMTRESRK